MRRAPCAARPEAVAIRDDIVAELERAGRALAMVEHGATILAQVRRRGRELEAQTSLKRGYLNLLHAKEAIDAPCPARRRTFELTAEPDGTDAHGHGPRPTDLTTATRPHHVVVSSRRHHKWLWCATRIPDLAERQECDALPPLRRAGHPGRRLA